MNSSGKIIKIFLQNFIFPMIFGTDFWKTHSTFFWPTYRSDSIWYETGSNKIIQAYDDLLAKIY